MPIIGSSASPKGVPTAPTIGTATAGNGSASVTFSAPSFSKLPITGYTVTASPGGATGTGASSPITVNGLTNGTAYTFTVKASHANGQSAASSASNSASPVAPVYALSQTFNSSGTYTVPAGASKIAVWGIGAGGGGTRDFYGGGASGGGGSMGAFKEYAVAPGSTFTVTIGTAGQGQGPANSSNATSGGASSFGNILVANGGNGASGQYTVGNAGTSTVNVANGVTTNLGAGAAGAALSGGAGAVGVNGAGGTSLNGTGAGYITQNLIGSSITVYGGGGGGSGASGAYRDTPNGDFGGNGGGGGGGGAAYGGNGGNGGAANTNKGNSGNNGGNANGPGGGGGGSGGHGAALNGTNGVALSGGSGGTGQIVVYVL